MALTSKKSSKKDSSWIGFFRAVDDELCRVAKTFWTMTGGKEHRVRWVCNRGKWGLTSIYPPKGSQRVSYLSCIHRIPEGVGFEQGKESKFFNADGFFCDDYT